MNERVNRSCGGEQRAEVASVGGFVRQYAVVVEPRRLKAFDIPLSKVKDAIRASNMDVGGRLVSEVMQRIAVPMIGGMVSSTIPTLVVIPALYSVVHGMRLPRCRIAAAAVQTTRSGMKV